MPAPSTTQHAAVASDRKRYSANPALKWFHHLLAAIASYLGYGSGERTRKASALSIFATAVIAALLVGGLTPAPSAMATDGAPRTVNIRKDHPRLIADQSRWSALREQLNSDTASRKLADSILSKANQLLTTAPISPTFGPEGHMLDTSRTVSNNVYLLTSAYQLTLDAKYLDRLWKDLEVAAKLPSWNPAHILDAAEMTQAFAVAYDWGYARWTASQRTVLRDSILRLGLTPALNDLNSGANWTKNPNNINLVANASFTMGALAITHETSSAVPQEVISKGLTSYRVGMGAYEADGSFPEGPTYWDYATRHVSLMMTSLQTSSASTWGLASDKRLATTAKFMQALTGPAGGMFGFADSALRVEPSASYAGLSRSLNQPSLSSLAVLTGSPSWPVHQLVWRTPPATPAGSPTPPLDASFASGVVSMRGNTSTSHSSYAGFRTSVTPSSFHQHLDAGDFNFQSLGREWATDLGMDDATYKLNDPTLADRRYNYYRMSPEGHNTLTFQPFAGEQRKPISTSLVKHGFRPDRSYAVADLTASASTGITSWQRGVSLFDGRQQLLVQDEIVATTPTEVMWSMHTASEVKIAADGRSAVLHQGGERLLLRIVSNDAHRLTAMPAAPLPTTEQLTQAANPGVTKLAIFFTASGSSTLAVQLTPLPAGSSSAAAPAPTSVTSLSSWSTPAAGTGSLSSVTLDGQALPGFNAAKTNYVVAGPAAKIPQVVATASSGTVTVQQATSATRTARVTYTPVGGSPITYVVSFPAVPLKVSTVMASSVTDGWASATFDGKPSTAWTTTKVDSYARWGLANPASLQSIRLTWGASAPSPVRAKVDISTDRINWTTKYDGEYGGGAVPQILAFPATTAQHVRVTLPNGGSVAEIEMFDYDIRPTVFVPDSTRLANATIAGLPDTMRPQESAQSAVVVKNTNGQTVTSASLRYVSSNPSAASFAADGTLQAHASGVVNVGVIATLNGVSVTASKRVSVVDPTRIRIYANADSYVQSSMPTTNYGTQHGMLVKPAANSPERIGYLRFDLSPLAGKTVTSASLNAEGVVSDGSTTPETIRVDAHVATGSWSEATVNYQNRPAMGATIGSFPVDRTRDFSGADITPHVAAHASARSGQLTVALTQDNIGSLARLVTVTARESKRPAYIDVTLAPSQPTALPARLLHSISLDNSPSSLEVGTSASVGATALDSLGDLMEGATLSYLSSNPAAVTVSGAGQLSAVTPGTANITVAATVAGITVVASKEVKAVDSTRVRIYADADSYVQSSTPTSNYGTQHGMLVKPPAGSPDRVGYLRFDLSQLAGKTIKSATLNAEGVVSDSSTTPEVVNVDVHVASGDWLESAVNYGNRPTMGETIGSFPVDRTRDFSGGDITGYVTNHAAAGSGEVTLALTQDNVGSLARLLTISARESGRGAYLDITLEP